MKPSPEITELPGMPPREFPKPAYKGGKKIPAGKRFRMWRTTEGKSRETVAHDIYKAARESTKEVRREVNLEGLTFEYLFDRIEELENSRSKPPTWLMFLIKTTYPQIVFPWWEFLDEARS